MRWIASAAMAAFVMSEAAAAAGEPPPSSRQESAAERELRRLDRDWAEFAVRGDLALYDRLTADDLVATHADGRLVTRAEERAYIKSSPERLASIATDEVTVRVYADTGVVRGRVTVTSKKGNRAVYRYTTVWLKRDRSWRLVAEQHTRLEPPRPPPAGTAGKTSPEEVVRAYAAACNDFDLAAFVALHSPAVRKYKRSDESGKSTPGARPGEFVLTTTGRDEVTRKYRDVFARTPRSVRVEIVSMISLGDLVLSRDRVTGFPDGHITDEITMYQVRDGLIQNIWYLERIVQGAASGSR